MATRSGKPSSKTPSANPDERQRSLFDDPAPASPSVSDSDPASSPATAPRKRGRPPKSGATPASPTRTTRPRRVAADDTAGKHETRVEGALEGRVEDQFETLPAAWQSLIAPFVASDAYAPLCRYVDAEVAAGKTVYPADIFHALRMTSPKDVKVVILGQDPYHGDDNGIAQAHGLAFSVQRGVRVPPSLRNIYKEIERDLGIAPPSHGNLDAWAKQGVLLLNTTLTVEAGNAASHAKPFRTGGWQACTDTLLSGLAAQQGPLVFMLWGSHAQAKTPLLAGHGHLLLEAPHPSPLSAHRGFLGCGHFSAANAFLEQHGKTPVDWRVPE